MATESLFVPIDPKKLATAISHVIPCAVRGDDSRPVLQCLLLEAKNGLATLVATDAFKLATSVLPVPLLEGEWLISAQEANSLEKELKRITKARVRGVLGEGLFFVLKDGTEKEIILHHQFPHSRFPDWRLFLPSSPFQAEAVFQSKALAEALKKIKPTSGRRAYPSRVFIEEKRIRLVAEDPDTEEKKEETIPARIKGTSARWACEAVYLKQLVRTLKGEITMKIQTTSRPALFESDKTQWLIGPLFVVW